MAKTKTTRSAPAYNKGKGRAIEWMHNHVGYKGDGCLIFPFYRLPNGYGQFGYLGENHYAHRFMCELINGPAPAGTEAAHSCGNGAGGCTHPDHLDWKTKSQNRLDALRHGTGVRGAVRGSLGSLSADQVKEIFSLKGKETQAKISERFGVSEPRIRAIFSGRLYRKYLEPQV